MKVKVINTPYVVVSKKLSQMNYGEKGYTVPWAYDPRTNELDLDFPVVEEKHGTCEMEVEKTESGYYEVYPPLTYLYP